MCGGHSFCFTHSTASWILRYNTDMHLSGLPWQRECCHRLPPKHLSLLEPLGKEEHLELCNQFVVQSWYGHGWNSCFRLLGSFCQGLPGLRVMSMPALGSRSTCSHIPVSQWACIYTINTHATNTIYWIVQSLYGLHYAVQLPNTNFTIRYPLSALKLK